MWAGHRDDPEGVRREHLGWVHLVGGMVGDMGPAYTPRSGVRKCRPWAQGAEASIAGGASQPARGVFLSGSPRVLLLYTLQYNPFITLSLYILLLLEQGRR